MREHIQKTEDPTYVCTYVLSPFRKHQYHICSTMFLDLTFQCCDKNFCGAVIFDLMFGGSFLGTRLLFVFENSSVLIPLLTTHHKLKHRITALHSASASQHAPVQPITLQHIIPHDVMVNDFCDGHRMQSCQSVV